MVFVSTRYSCNLMRIKLYTCAIIICSWLWIAELRIRKVSYNTSYSVVQTAVNLLCTTKNKDRCWIYFIFCLCLYRLAEKKKNHDILTALHYKLIWRLYDSIKLKTPSKQKWNYKSIIIVRSFYCSMIKKLYLSLFMTSSWNIATFKT